MDMMGDRTISVNDRVTLRFTHKCGVVRWRGLHTYRLHGGGMMSCPSALVEIDCDGRILETYCPLDSLIPEARS